MVRLFAIRHPQSAGATLFHQPALAWHPDPRGIWVDQNL